MTGTGGPPAPGENRADSVTLRPATDDDAEFLLAVYASTRDAELAQADWDAATKDAFLRQQADLQHRYYASAFPDVRFDVIMLGDRPVGRLYISRKPDEIRGLDIALLPAYRNRGIGTRLVNALIAEAWATGRPFTCAVEKNNPGARRLYERLGMVVSGELAYHWLMERARDGPTGAPPEATEAG